MTWEGPRQPQLRETYRGSDSELVQEQRSRIKRSQSSILAERLKEDPTIWFFWALLITHVVVWTILPASTQPNVPAETLNLLSLGQTPALGYHNSPPLAAWLVSFACLLTAPAVWPAYFLAQLCTVTCIWSAWKMAREFLHPWTALCAAIVLEGCYFFSLTSPSLTSGHVSRCFWALAVLMLFRALTRPRRRYWAATGLFLGLGILSNYGTVLLVIAMFVFLLLNDRARRCWDSSWPIFGMGIMGLVLLPHILWLMGNGGSTLTSAMDPSGEAANRILYPMQFGVSQFLAVVPMLFLLYPLVAWFNLEEPSNSTDDDDREFARRYLLWVTILPPCVLIATSVMGGLPLNWLSGTPLWTFTGVLFLLWSHLQENRDAWRKVILRSAAMSGAFAALLVVMNIMIPTAREQATSIHFPGEEIAQRVEKTWSEWYDKPLPIVAGPAEFAQNASWYGKFHASIFLDLDVSKSVNVTDGTLMSQGGIIIWDASKPYTQEQIERFGNVLILEPEQVKWKTRAKIEPITIQMALVHPEQPLAITPSPAADISLAAFPANE